MGWAGWEMRKRVLRTSGVSVINKFGGCPLVRSFSLLSCLPGSPLCHATAANCNRKGVSHWTELKCLLFYPVAWPFKLVLFCHQTPRLPIIFRQSHSYSTSYIVLQCDLLTGYTVFPTKFDHTSPQNWAYSNIHSEDHILIPGVGFNFIKPGMGFNFRKPGVGFNFQKPRAGFNFRKPGAEIESHTLFWKS